MSTLNRTFRVVVASFFSICAYLPFHDAAQAAVFRVSQESSSGSGDFDANVLGFVNPFSTSLSTAAFYQYDTPDVFSYNGDENGGPSPISQLSQIFLLDASDGLSLVVVHDNPNDGSGGSTSMQWNLTGDTAAQVLADDPSELVSVSGGGTQFNSTKNWLGCCTDGYALGSLDGDGWAMFGQFLTAPIGINQWAVSSFGSTSISLDLEAGRRVRLDLTPVPVPAALPLLAGGLGLMGFLGWRRRRKAAAR